MNHDEVQVQGDKEEARRHATNLYWAEIKPKLWNVLGMVLLAATVGIAIHMTFGWALLPLAGAVFSFYEAKVAQNEFYLNATQAEADIRSEQESRNLWEAQQKVQNRAQEKAQEAAAAAHDHGGGPQSDMLVNSAGASKPWAEMTPKKDPVRPLAEMPVNATTSMQR